MSAFAWQSRRRQREIDEPLPLLPGYGAQNVLQRHRGKLAGLLFVLTLFYALSFQIIGRFIPVYFVIPLALMILLIIWALPETGRPPTRVLTGLFYAFFAGMLLWPDYFAIALPGLPWITVLRLTTLPMAFILLIALSVSGDFRRQLKQVIAADRLTVALVALFTVLSVFSIVFSDALFHTFNRIVIIVLGWTSVFFVACYVAAQPGAARRLAMMIWGATAFWLVMSLWEWWIGHVPWADHVPSFLAVGDDLIEKVLQGSNRYGGAYRVQAKFFVPISFGEFLAVATPFIIHWAMTADRLVTRMAAAVTLPLIFAALIGTDSRLGMGGFLLSFMVYALAWGVRRWRHVRHSIFGPAVVVAYPIGFAAFIAATFFVGRLRNKVWGGGQHISSNEAREVQWEMGLPLIKSQPWGHGVGLSGYTLGYTAPDGTLSVDSYYLTLLLDVGVLGFAAFLGIFAAVLYSGGRRVIDAPEGESLWLIPSLIALLNFVIIKAVLSQIENHPLIFAILGMAVALMWRIGQAPQPAQAPRFPREVRRAPLRPRALAGQTAP